MSASDIVLVAISAFAVLVALIEFVRVVFKDPDVADMHSNSLQMQRNESANTLCINETRQVDSTRQGDYRTQLGGMRIVSARDVGSYSAAIREGEDEESKRVRAEPTDNLRLQNAEEKVRELAYQLAEAYDRGLIKFDADELRGSTGFLDSNPIIERQDWTEGVQFPYKRASRLQNDVCIEPFDERGMHNRIEHRIIIQNTIIVNNRGKRDDDDARRSEGYPREYLV